MRVCALLLMGFTLAWSAETINVSMYDILGIIDYGYKSQLVELVHRKDDPRAGEALITAKAGIAGTAVSPQDLATLLDLFRPQVGDKTASRRAWERVALSDYPDMRIMLDSSTVLGFMPEWSVVMIKGNVVEEFLDGDRILTCDQILSPKYHNVTVFNKLPLQYLEGNRTFVITRDYFTQIHGFVDTILRYRPEDLPSDFVPGRFADGADSARWDLFWVKCHRLGWSDRGDAFAFECASDRAKVKGRLVGAHIKGFQFLARASSAVEANLVVGAADNFNSIYLNIHAVSTRQGLGALVKLAKKDGGKNMSALYLESIVENLRDKHSGGVAHDSVTSYLLGCPESELRTLLQDGFVRYLSVIIEGKWKTIIANNADLSESDLHEAMVSLRSVLPEHQDPYVIEAQWQVQRGRIDLARSALNAGIGAITTPYALGKLKYTLYIIDKNVDALVDHQATITRLKEIVGLMRSDPEPVIELANWYARDELSEKAVEVLRHSLMDMSGGDRELIEQEIVKFSGKIP